MRDDEGVLKHGYEPWLKWYLDPFINLCFVTSPVSSTKVWRPLVRSWGLVNSVVFLFETKSRMESVTWSPPSFVQGTRPYGRNFNRFGKGHGPWLVVVVTVGPSHGVWPVLMIVGTRKVDPLSYREVGSLGPWTPTPQQDPGVPIQDKVLLSDRSRNESDRPRPKESVLVQSNLTVLPRLLRLNPNKFNKYNCLRVFFF